MHKIILYCLAMLATGSCTTRLQANKEKPKSREEAQISCRTPLNISADSLTKIIQYETEWRFKDSYRVATYDSFAIRKYRECIKRGIKIEEAFRECQSYMVRHLGKFVYCTYVFPLFNTITVYDNNNAELCFGFSLPGLRAGDKRIWADSLLDEGGFCFQLPAQPDGKLVILYPKMPDCANARDCGFTLSKQAAIDTLLSTGFLHPGDNYSIELTENFQWQVTKRHSGLEDIIELDLKSRKISPVRHPIGID